MDEKYLVGTLSAQLIDAMLLDFEAEAGSHAEAVATGAVFALARTAHALEGFDKVVRASAEDLVMSVEELRDLLPTADAAADARDLFDSIS